jgi:Tudor domain
LDKTNSYLRAYRLNSFPANKSAIRSFLIDTGVEVFENFSHGRYFKLPDKFNYTDPLAIFCNLETFPTSEDVELKSEFLEKMMFRRMKFNVKRQITLENALGSSNLCIVVEVEYVEEADEVYETPNEFTWNTRPESPPKEEKTFLPELSFMDGSCDEHVPFPACFVLRNTDLPEPGETLTIYCTEVLSPSTLYACYNKKENFTNDYFPESLSVELLMNDDDVVECYENLHGEPTVGEMVITIGRDSRYHRGLVKAIAGNFYMVSPMEMILDSQLNNNLQVFFVDFGYTLPVEFEQIFKFPRECAALPFQAVHLTIDGMTSLGDPKSDAKAVEIMSSKLSIAMAVVL